MRTTLTSLSNSLWLLIALSTAADPARAVTIDTVPVGNPGNGSDTNGRGSVDYDFRIGRFEVTNTQYAEFLNSIDPTGANSLALCYCISTSSNGIVSTGDAPIGAKYSAIIARSDHPVSNVTWYDAARFANWLHNGQGSGNTEDGAYTLLGGTPTPSNALSIPRNAGAKWWLPSEDEWYKAAYHRNDGVTANYWDYATSTDAIPYSDQPPGIDTPDPTNTANFFKSDGIANGYDAGYAVTGSTSVSFLRALTPVGAYSLARSPYGTFDQSGNVVEWNDTMISGAYYIIRGGGWDSGSIHLHASFRNYDNPVENNISLGFRVAAVPVPEPTTIVLVLMTLAVTALLRYGLNSRRTPMRHAVFGQFFVGQSMSRKLAQLLVQKLQELFSRSRVA